MEGLLSALPKLVEAFGPVATVLLILVFVLGWIYRKDHLRKHSDSKAELERRAKQEERMISALEANAMNNERVAGAIHMLSDIVAGRPR